MNLLRGMIGPGCLALPVAFKKCGLWVGRVDFESTCIANELIHVTYYVRFPGWFGDNVSSWFSEHSLYADACTIRSILM